MPEADATGIAQAGIEGGGDDLVCDQLQLGQGTGQIARSLRVEALAPIGWEQVSLEDRDEAIGDRPGIGDQKLPFVEHGVERDTETGK